MATDKTKGLEKTPEKAAGPVTPERVPEDTGHLSGSEWNWLHSKPAPPKK